MAIDRQVGKILHKLVSSRIVNFSGQPVSAYDLGDFYIQQMRRMPVLL